MTWTWQFPLCRCPYCRHWVEIVTRGDVKVRRPSKTRLDAIIAEQPKAEALKV